MLFFIFACFNNFIESEILPSLSNCKFVLSAKIDVEKTSLFSSNGFRESIAEDLVSAFGTLYASFEEAAMNEASIVDAGFEGEWIQPFVEMSVENIIPPFVEIRGILTLKVETNNGVETIREALLAAEKNSSPEDEIEVHCYYNGAPEYRIELRAPDFKTAEDTWTASLSSVVSVVEAAGGTADSYRE